MATSPLILHKYLNKYIDYYLSEIEKFLLSNKIYKAEWGNKYRTSFSLLKRN